MTASGEGALARDAGGRRLGLYVHVPFCSAKCPYCSFYSVPITRSMLSAFMSALAIEVESASRDPLVTESTFETLYIGGGTPSLLPVSYLKEMLQSILGAFRFEDGAEVTLEVNPESLSPGHAILIAGLPGGRLSIGVQSLCDAALRALGRRHDAATAARSMELAERSGVPAVSVDLIYGAPGQSSADWALSLDRVIAAAPHHVSCYCLSLDDGTVLAEMVGSGRPRDSTLSAMYYSARDALLGAGYEHYEISNFARAGFRSRHNSRYWRREEYLGMGPSAHSFLGGSRWSNVGDAAEYCRRLRSGESPTGWRERVTERQGLEETVMLALRTADGLDTSALSEAYGEGAGNSLHERAEPMLRAGMMDSDGAVLRISPAAYFVSDSVISTLLAERP